MNINDAILNATGGPSVNDGLASWFGKQPDEALDDAEYRYLADNGAPRTQVDDMWYVLLRAAGYTGSLSDMLLAWWTNGGTWPVAVANAVLHNGEQLTHNGEAVTHGN